ncbi:MAG: hypothetical protein SynsKO_07270 [Synoicihabitans sp.]
MNRGNYKSDIFADQGAAHAFVQTLEETTERFGWRLGAYVVMRNHYHLAIQTPEPNLAAGMHWLQCTFATRFNRMRDERGHLFQGRYKAILLETNTDWARVVDYIHLNPVRAKIVPTEHVLQFRWSSLIRFVKGPEFRGLTSVGWYSALGLGDDPSGWIAYGQHLAKKASDLDSESDDEAAALTRGWAVGSDAWKTEIVKRLLRESGQSSETEGLQLPPEMLPQKWQLRLDQELRLATKTQEDIARSMKSANWKIEIADRMQRELGASVTWLAAALKMGKPSSLRAYLWRTRKNQEITT